MPNRLFWLLILSICPIGLVKGNMGNPEVVQEQVGSTLFLARHVDILHEWIHIRISVGAKEVFFEIEYLIQSDSTGNQIPFLFHAPGYAEDFRISLDGEPLPLLLSENGSYAIPPSWQAFSGEGWDEKQGFFTLARSLYANAIVYRNELVPFEVDLPDGSHRFKASYHTWMADQHYDRYVKANLAYYSLAPAKTWRSFGQLDVELDARESPFGIETNLGPPLAGRTDSIAAWHFEALPADYIELKSQMELTAWDRFMLVIMAGLGWLPFALALYFHLGFLVQPPRRDQRLVAHLLRAIPFLAVPLLLTLSPFLQFLMEDMYLGEASTGTGVYAIFFIFIYPAIAGIYGLVMLLIQTLVRKVLKDHPRTVFSKAMRRLFLLGKG